MGVMEKIDAQWLQRWPLPALAEDTDKAGRGRMLLVAGCAENPGAAVLAAAAALRAGVGKLTIVTAAAAATAVAIAVPEARVIGVPQEAIASPGIDVRCAFDDAWSFVGASFDAAVIGPGLLNERQTCEFVHWLLPRLDCPRVILDAGALAAASERPATSRVLITPHAGEMAHLCGTTKEAAFDNADLALAKATQWNAVVALKGARLTLIATPEGRLLRHEGGNIGLAVSGSGDVLAGAIGAFAARGCELEHAAAWGVYLHSAAGDRLAQRWGSIGFLPRELPDQLPVLAGELS